MSDLVPVQQDPSLARDPKTGAIVNINTTEVTRARKRKKHVRKDKQQIQQLITEVYQLKHDVADIKTMLEQLAEKQ